MMLASLLPGIRDLRTPLATGYAWLLAVWLTFGRDTLTPGRDNAFVARIYDFGAQFGTAASIAIASFVAYLLGSLLVVRRLGTRSTGARSAAASINILRLVARMVGAIPEMAPLSRKAFEDWADDVLARLSRRGTNVARLIADDTFGLPPRFVQVLSRHDQAVSETEVAAELGLPVVDDAVFEERERRVWRAALREWLLVEEFDTLTLQLQLERETYYDAYDRMTSEAEIRLSIALPLTWISAVAVAQWSAWAGLGLLIPLALVVQALRLQSQARARVVQALTSSVISSPLVEALEAEKGLSAETQAQVEQRANAAAEAALQLLGEVGDTIIEYHRARNVSPLTEDAAADIDVVRSQHDRLLAQFEATIVLLSSPQREELETLLTVVRFAHDLPERSSGARAGWHPDSAAQISAACVRSARAVIASHMRHEDLPARSPQFAEYLKAVEERNDDLLEEFAEEVGDDEARIAEWRQARGMSASRVAG